MAFENIASISHIERKELRRKGIKSPSKIFFPKYLSPASIVELYKNPSASKRVHFVNSIVILSKENEAEEGETTTDITPEHDQNLTKKRKEKVKEVIDEEESDVETDKEVKEILEDKEEEEDDEYGENFNSLITMEELTQHEWLLKNPRPRCFAYEYDFMILEDTTSIIDRHLGEMAFGRPFIDETDIVYNKEEGTCMRTRRSYFPITTNVTIPRRRQRKQNSNIVEPDIRTIVEMADNRTMVQMLQAPIEGYEDAIVVPPINANNFELKQTLINLVQSNQFTGRQDPHNHLRFFNKVTSTFRHPEVPNTTIKLLLFPFSLEDEARIWLDKEPPRSILTWEDLVSKFIN
nr:reverse transcriptase domain-containing protein [Tanacetum cinerariifolium]